MTFYWRKVATALALTACFGGCGANDGMENEETVESTEEALGETACSTVGGTPYSGGSSNGQSISLPSDPNCGYTYTGATTPNTSYNNTGCSNQWITEISNPHPRKFTPYVNWADTTPTTQASCENSWRYMTVWVRWPGDGNWYKYQGTDYSKRGSWSTFFGSCFFDSFGPGLIDNTDPLWGFDKVRVVAAAYNYSTKKKLTAGVRHGPGPC
jgi:hypothetical protein